MHVSMMVRRAVGLLPVVAIAAACSDAPSAPRVAERPGFYTSELQMAASKSAPAKGGKSPKDQISTTGVATFTVDPRVSRVYAFGENWVYFPANSICDPATSGYGPGTWDTPCAPLTTPITITATWTPKGGHGYVDFQPAMRFAPSSNMWQWVIVSIKDRQMVSMTSSYSILYQVGDDSFVDESLSDPTLKAYIDWSNNTIYRRLKHFSGYMIQAGSTTDGGLLDASY